MTLRTLFLLCGLAMMAPQVLFLWILKSADNVLPTRHPTQGWWLATALRLLSVTVLLGGFRVAVVNGMNADTPVHFTNWFDQSTAIITLVLGAVSSILFFAVFVRNRDWDV